MSFVDFSACISLYFSWHKVNDIRILLQIVYVSMGHLWNNDMNEEDATRSIPSVSFLFKVVPTYSVCLVCLKFPVVRCHLETMKLKKKKGIDHCISLFLARGWENFTSFNLLS